MHSELTFELLSLDCLELLLGDSDSHGNWLHLDDRESSKKNDAIKARIKSPQQPKGAADGSIRHGQEKLPERRIPTTEQTKIELQRICQTY